MGALFFISTVVFLVLFLGARSENSRLISEIGRLRRELFELKRKTGQDAEPQSTDEIAKIEEPPTTDIQSKSASSSYDMSYKSSSLAEKSVAFTADNAVGTQNSPAEMTSSNAAFPSDAPKPQPTAPMNVPAPEKHRVSSINVLLVIGSLFIILAGFIFATTTWANLGNILKAVIILSFSAVLFAVSSIAERKLELPRTGKVFYTLGCAFLPITVFAIAYFKVFGEWFSFEGGGTFVVIAVATALAAAVCFKGSYDYESKNFAWVALSCVSATVAALAYQIFVKPDAIMLAYAIYSLIVIFISRFIQKKAVKLDAFAYAVEILPSFELGNTAMLSIASLIVPAAWLDHSVIVTIACGLFAAAYLFSGFSKKNGFAGAIPFLLFIGVASFYGISPDSFSEGTYVVAVIATVVSVLSLLNVLPEKLAYALKMLSNICIGISAAALGIAAVSSKITTATVIVMALLSCEILALGLFRRGETAGKTMFVIFSFALSATLLSAASLITSTETAFAIAASCAILAVSIGYVITDAVLSKKGKEFILRSAFSDVMFSAFTVAVIIKMLECGEIGLAEPLCTAAMMFAFTFFPKKEWEKGLFSLTAMLSLGTVAFSNVFGEDASYSTICTVISVVLAVIAVAFVLFKKDKLAENGAIAGFTIATSFNMIVSSFSLFTEPDPVWHLYLILALVYTVKGCISRNKASISAAIVLACVTFAIGANEIFDLEDAAQLVAAGGFAAVLFAVLLFISENDLTEYCKKFTSICLNVISFILLCILASTGTVSTGVNIGTAVILAMTVTSGYMTSCTVLLTPTLAAAYFAVVSQLENVFEESEHIDVIIGCAAAALIAISIGASYLLHRNKVIEKNGKLLSFDSFAFSRLIGLAAYYSSVYGDKEEWFGLWLICAVVLSFMRRGNSSAANRGIISAAMFVPIIAWWTQPFFELPENLALEINIVPILLYLAALRLLKWNKKWIDDLTFIAYIIVYVILFFNALNGAIENALIVMISALVVLAVSFLIKMKRWFVLGAVVITTSAIFMSIKLWGSPAWWVYLLAAGVILIAVGAVNEQKKKSAENNSVSKLSRFMSEWTW